jgi:invasion protein IalB
MNVISWDHGLSFVSRLKWDIAVGVIAALMAPGAVLAADDPPKDGEKSAWVKLCEKAPVSKSESKEVCITHHERVDAKTGLPIISAAVRTIEGQDTMRFLVTLPLGVAVPPGMQVTIDEMKEPVKLSYKLCLPNGCTAETEATPELMKKLSTGQVLQVVAFSAVGEPINFQVPLRGFRASFDGKPIDTSIYGTHHKERGKLMLRIRENMIKRAKAAQDAAAKDEVKKQ